MRLGPLWVADDLPEVFNSKYREMVGAELGAKEGRRWPAGAGLPIEPSLRASLVIPNLLPLRCRSTRCPPTSQWPGERMLEHLPLGCVCVSMAPAHVLTPCCPCLLTATLPFSFTEFKKACRLPLQPPE